MDSELIFGSSLVPKVVGIESISKHRIWNDEERADTNESTTIVQPLDKKKYEDQLLQMCLPMGWD